MQVKDLIRDFPQSTKITIVLDDFSEYVVPAGAEARIRQWYEDSETYTATSERRVLLVQATGVNALLVYVI